MNEENSRALSLFLRIMRGFSLYASFILIHLVASFCFRASQLQGLEEELLILLSVRTLLIPLVFFSVARIFAEEDHAINRTLGDPTDLHLFAKFCRLFSSKALLLEGGIVLTLALALPANVGFFSLKSLFALTSLPTAFHGLVITAIELPLLSLLYLLARISAWQKYADERGARGEITRAAEQSEVADMVMHTASDATFGSAPNGIPRHGGTRGFGGEKQDGLARRSAASPSPFALFWRIPLIFAYYVIGCLILTFFAPILISFYFILAAIGTIRWWLPILLILSGVGAFWLFFLLRAVHIRQRFFRNLKTACRDYGFSYSKPRRPFASLFYLGEEINFQVFANGKTYDCKLFASIRRHCPLFFHENGVVKCIHSLRFRRIEYLSFTTSYRFDFESENEKICIVAPVPKTVYAGDEHWHRPIDTGMAVGGYRIFSSTGFIGALTRNCIERD